MSDELQSHLARSADAEEYRPTVYVDVGVETMVNRFNNKYTIYLDDEMNRNCRLALVFPYHPREKYRLTYTTQYGHMSSMQKDLNRRLKDSTKRIMYVATHNTLYVLEGIEGNVYIAWARYINVVTSNDQETQVAEQVPIFIETDCEGSYRSVFVFPDPEDHRQNANTHLPCLRVMDCTFLETHGSNLFCLESDPRQPVVQLVSTLSKEEALSIAQNPVARLAVTMDQEREPFPSDSDD